MAGLEQAMAALVGGSAIESAGADRALTRLTAQRAAQERLDKLIEENRVLKSKGGHRDALEGMLDLGEISSRALLSGDGTNYAATQRGRGDEMRNEVLGMAVEAITSGKELPPDMLNKIVGVSSGKMLSPSNVKVEGQANAAISADSALANARNAQANKYNSDTPADAVYTEIPATQIALSLGADQKAVNEFYAWQERQLRAGNTAMNNTNDALRAYAVYKQGGGAGQSAVDAISGGADMGTSEATAIPWQQFGDLPPPKGTWIIDQNGNRRPY